MIALLAAGVLSPFFFEATPEVRSTYQSLGKIVEDRPMQITLISPTAGEGVNVSSVKGFILDVFG